MAKIIQFIFLNLFLLLFLTSNAVYAQSPSDWYMLGANPQRTSWVSEEVRGNLSVEWYRPIEPYIPYKVQPIFSNGNVYISTARGLYAFKASDGSQLWVYPTELPLGHSPTVINNVAYVGGYDKKIHAIDTNTGQALSGYTPYTAEAGFETNPLVISNVIYAGNRDGYFYALNATTGNLIWRFKTDGPILFSAAYKDNTLYFASNDSYAYAVNTQGQQVWKSQKLPGAGFHSFWPVIYTDKSTSQDYVVFPLTHNYRSLDLGLAGADGAYLFPTCFTNPPTCTWGEVIWPESTSSDSYWTQGARLIDVSRISQYYEAYPYRRTVAILNRNTGQEYTFDSNSNGIAEYAPISYAGGSNNSGTKYPPMINNIDGIYYQETAYLSAPWIIRGDIVGWKPGNHFVSRVEGGITGHAGDEPMSYASGGKVIYWSLCGDREMGAYDVTIPYGQPNRSWQYISYDLLTKAPDYQPMYFNGDESLYNDMNGWQVYSGKNQSKNGIYDKQGTTQSPPIPYQGKVYVLKGNTLLALKSGVTSPIKLPLAPIVSQVNELALLSRSEVQSRLQIEIEKMLTAGHLRPGYYGNVNSKWGSGCSFTGMGLGPIEDYFQTPADTVVTLLAALPSLPIDLQSRVKTYLQTYYGPSGTYPFTTIANIGWRDGASREVFDIPPDVISRYQSGPSSYPGCDSAYYWSTYPPFGFYAAWKYAQEFGGANAIYTAMRGKLDAPPSDLTNFHNKPYMFNLYIAGYRGYLELQALAGVPEDPVVRTTYNNLLNVRVSDFSKNTPFAVMAGPSGGNNIRSISVARNFMFMTPELGDYLYQNALTKMQEATSEYTYVAPYWFVSKYDATSAEATFQHLYDSPALFQAKAYILKEPYEELVKYLDVPAFAVGDLFYIQNLVAALSAASGGGSPTPTPIPIGDFNNDGKIDVSDLILLLFNYQTTDMKYDLNKDGGVNVFDGNVLVGNIGK